MNWQPPETAPKDRAILITTAGPQVNIVAWDALWRCFYDYFHKQKILQEWPYMIGWAELPSPAKIGNTEAETRALNGWEPKT